MTSGKKPRTGGRTPKTVEVGDGQRIYGIFDSEAKAKRFQKELKEEGIRTRMYITLGEAPPFIGRVEETVSEPPSSTDEPSCPVASDESDEPPSNGTGNTSHEKDDGPESPFTAIDDLSERMDELSRVMEGILQQLTKALLDDGHGTFYQSMVAETGTRNMLKSTMLVGLQDAEETTRKRIIDPLIRFLGWDPDEQGDVLMNTGCGVDSRRADYKLFIELHDRDFILVEAEPLHKELYHGHAFKKKTSGIPQTRNYLHYLKDIDTAITTDGMYWHLVVKTKGDTCRSVSANLLPLFKYADRRLSGDPNPEFPTACMFRFIRLFGRDRISDASDRLRRNEPICVSYHGEMVSVASLPREYGVTQDDTVHEWRDLYSNGPGRMEPMVKR